MMLLFLISLVRRTLIGFGVNACHEDIFFSKVWSQVWNFVFVMSVCLLVYLSFPYALNVSGAESRGLLHRFSCFLKSFVPFLSFCILGIRKVKMSRNRNNN